MEKKENFSALIERFAKEDKPVFINGVGAGKISGIEKDFVKVTVIREQDSKNQKKLYRETTYIPIQNICSLSEGEKEIPKSEQEMSIDNDLGDI